MPHDELFASWRLKRADALVPIWAWRPENQEGQCSHWVQAQEKRVDNVPAEGSKAEGILSYSAFFE